MELVFQLKADGLSDNLAGGLVAQLPPPEDARRHVQEVALLVQRLDAVSVLHLSHKVAHVVHSGLIGNRNFAALRTHLGAGKLVGIYNGLTPPVFYDSLLLQSILLFFTSVLQPWQEHGVWILYT